MAASAEVTAAICDFLEVSTHQLLFLQQLYPPESFEPCMFVGVPVHTNRHPDVSNYVHSAVSDLQPLLRQGHVKHVEFTVHKSLTASRPTSQTTLPPSTSPSTSSPAEQSGSRSEARVVFGFELKGTTNGRQGCEVVGGGEGGAGPSAASCHQGKLSWEETQQLEQAFRTALLELSTAKHTPCPGCSWELVAHSAVLPCVKGPQELRTWVSKSEGRDPVQQHTDLVINPISSFTCPVISLQLYGVEER